MNVTQQFMYTGAGSLLGEEHKLQEDTAESAFDLSNEDDFEAKTKTTTSE